MVGVFVVVCVDVYGMVIVLHYIVCEYGVLHCIVWYYVVVRCIVLLRNDVDNCMV